MLLTRTSSIFIITLLFAASSLFVVTNAEAKTVVRTGDEVSITEDQKISGDFYSAASKINVSGEVQADFLVAAGSVTVNGTIGSDALIIGGSVDVHGTIGDDLRVVGGDVTLAETVIGDVFVFGGSIKILSTASIGGDLLVFGGDVEVSGPIEGDVLGHTGALRIDSVVSGSVDVTTEQLTLGERADIGGDVRYVSHNLVIRSQNAAIGGETVRSDVAFEATSFSPRSLLAPILIILFTVALWYLLARRMLTRVVRRALVPGIRPILVGVLFAVLTPFAVSVLMVSMLGFAAGLILLLGYLLFFLLGVIATPAVVGQLIMNLSSKQTETPSLLSLFVGSVVTGLCLFVPVVGPIALFGFYILTFGAIIDLLLRANR